MEKSIILNKLDYTNLTNNEKPTIIAKVWRNLDLPLHSEKREFDFRHAYTIFDVIDKTNNCITKEKSSDNGYFILIAEGVNYVEFDPFIYDMTNNIKLTKDGKYEVRNSFNVRKKDIKTLEELIEDNIWNACVIIEDGQHIPNIDKLPVIDIDLTRPVCEYVFEYARNKNLKDEEV